MKRLDEQRLPRHVGLIMDGNRRWAEARGKSAQQGHEAGVNRLREIVRHASKLPLAFLSIYGFSINNWQRSETEVAFLMKMVRSYIKLDLAELHQNNVQMKFLGRRDTLPKDILLLIDEAQALTKNNAGLVLAIAFNYGGQDEIVRAVETLVKNNMPASLETIAQALDSHPMPPVDLLVRTGGEQRLSDFMLWQNAYAELVFVKDFWPDFTPELFIEALGQYACRERRFGADSKNGKA